MYEKILYNKAAQTQLLILDVDGVLTDGKIWYGEHGEIYKSFHIHDGHGIKNLIKNGIQVAIISGRNSSIVEKRLKDLGIQHYYLGQEDKLFAYNDLLQKLNVQPEHIAYVGDDVLDIPVMKEVGLAIAVSNAISEVREIAYWKTQKQGGEGAVREVCDLILTAQSSICRASASH